ncbi:MAG: hypothetical protein K0Q72_3687 [Armatimonadetes bacterium]|nr:hypothetical protein [Armatimonadota bacterium]
MDPHQAREELLHLLAPGGSGASADLRSGFPLDRVGLLLAADEYPFLDPSLYESQLEELAARTSEAARAGSSSDEPRVRLGALRRVLFEEEAFHGDRDNYYDVRNSYLNEVLDRKRGIPISLGAVMVGVARRLDWPLASVNFPNHFLLAYVSESEPLAVDPFHGGLILGQEELEERWRAAIGTSPPPLSRMLQPAEPKSVVIRMLNNIWMVHANARRFHLAILAKEKIALIDPEEPDHERELGYLWVGAGDTARGAEHLSRYLSRAPHASDRGLVADHVARLQRGAE